MQLLAGFQQDAYCMAHTATMYLGFSDDDAEMAMEAKLTMLVRPRHEYPVRSVGFCGLLFCWFAVPCLQRCMAEDSYNVMAAIALGEELVAAATDADPLWLCRVRYWTLVRGVRGAHVMNGYGWSINNYINTRPLPNDTPC